jgi:hypothetical protein
MNTPLPEVHRSVLAPMLAGMAAATSDYLSAEAIGYIFYYQKMKPMASNTMGAPRVKKWFPTSSGMLFLDQIMTSLKLP